MAAHSLTRLWYRVTFPAQLLALGLPLSRIRVTVKRAWLGRVWVTRSERSNESDSRLNEGGQEYHYEDDNLRPQRDVLKQ